MNSFQISVLVCFLVLMLICAALVGYSDTLGASAGEELSKIASHGFTFTLGSIIGALIAMTGSRSFNNG